MSSFKSCPVFILILIFLIVPNKSIFAQNPESFQRAEQIFAQACAACHGGQMQAYVDREWKYGSSREALFETIKFGREDVGMPPWGALYSDEEIEELVAYLQYGIANVDKYKFQAVAFEPDTLNAGAFSFYPELVFEGGQVPWGMAFLPGDEILVTDRGGEIFHVDTKGKVTKIRNVPECLAEGQGGMLDILPHPDFIHNKMVYFSYSAEMEENGEIVATTVVDRAKLVGMEFREVERIFEAKPYVRTRHHYGSRMVFDDQGYLYISVGDRGRREVHPQDLSVDPGKIHRIHEDGRIPDDNPFNLQGASRSSVFSLGHRNPQGMDIHPLTGEIWTHEHGPRGGDEINIIKPGRNFGWPLASRGLNYNMTKFTDSLEMKGMEPALHYWVPSIAPSGMAFVRSDKYPGWENDLLVGSLRFRYLNLCELDGKQMTGEKQLLRNIGRVRDVRINPEGYIFVAVEDPGRIYKLVPVKN